MLKGTSIADNLVDLSVLEEFCGDYSCSMFPQVPQFPPVLRHPAGRVGLWVYAGNAAEPESVASSPATGKPADLSFGIGAESRNVHAGRFQVQRSLPLSETRAIKAVSRHARADSAGSDHVMRAAEAFGSGVGAMFRAQSVLFNVSSKWPGASGQMDLLSVTLCGLTLAQIYEKYPMGFL
jgi:hypothetical protein